MKNTRILHCAIIDDEPLAVEGLKRHLQSIKFLNLTATFHNAIEASSFLEVNPVDLLFLDIKMPQLSGLGMLQSLTKKPLVIFITADPNHALEAFRHDAVDYLLKPFSFESLIKAINKALLLTRSKTQPSTEEYIFIRSDGKFHRCDFKDILYVEGMKDYVSLHLRDEVLIVAMNLSSIGKKLPPDRFMRVHKSFIVNKQEITKFNSFELLLNSQIIPIGSTYREELQHNILTDNLISK
jgi:DNA-binding LytR/AlgR family response regulator